jgi:hypothetical protein
VHDLEERIRTYAEHLEDTIPMVGVETAQRIAQRQPHSRRMIPAVAAAVLVILVIAAVVILDPFGSEAPFIEEPTTLSTTSVPVSTTVASDTTVTPPTSAPTAPAIEQPTISWTRIESEAFSGDGQAYIADVIEGGPGLVAVGSIFPGDDVPYQAAIWHSTDGTSWSRVPHDGDLFGEALINAVVDGGPGLVAVGSAEQGDDSSAAVWVSEDGLSWSRVPHDEEVFGGPYLQNMSDVAVGGPGLVAVGWDNDDVNTNSSAAVWTSSDGVNWDRVPRDEETFGGRLMQLMYALTYGDTGLVAVGLDGAWWGAAGPGNPAGVWTSSDGLVWSHVLDQEQLESGHSTEGIPLGGDWAQMNDVTVVDGSYVAVGRVGWCREACDETGAAWTSTDGTTWQRSEVERAVGIFAADMQSVTALGDVLIGVGRGGNQLGPGGYEFRFTAYEVGPAVVWISVDNGQTWVRQPHSGAAFGKASEGPAGMTAVARYGSALVAGGYWESDAAVWIGNIEE